MEKDELLTKAIQIAVDAHRNQFDKNGAPYIGHPIRVMNMGITMDEKICGVLHDVVEDTFWTFEMLENEGYPQHIIEALKCVSKVSEEEPYGEFIERVKRNKLAIRVKINDLTDNLDVKRYNELGIKEIERLKKYLKWYRVLSNINVE